MDWSSVDWQALEKLRDVFLDRAGPNGGGPYWTSDEQITSYDYTLGRRIAWKWAAVLEPLCARGWSASARQIVDWGCGSGLAARSLLAHAAPGSFDEVLLWDYSPLATRFATAAILARHPQVRVRVADPLEAALPGKFVLVVSHVLNELDQPGRDALIALARKASDVLWVEPGTAADSRTLVGVREVLRNEFNCVAPCPHNQTCGLLMPDNARHWCHHFATPPTEAFTESGWSEFSRRLGIDLRSLPYSYLVLDRRRETRSTDAVRLIGEPRQSAGVMRLLRCREEGVREIELQKRSVPGLWRTLDKRRHAGLFRWDEVSGRITEGEKTP